MNDTKKKSIELHNGTPFVPEFEKGKTLFYRIVSGTAYQFAVEVLENGGDSARYEVSTYYEGEVVCVLPEIRNEKETIKFVLTGSLHTSIVPVEISEITNNSDFSKISQAFSAIRTRDDTEEIDASALLNSSDSEEKLRTYLFEAAKKIVVQRSNDLQEESNRFILRQKACLDVYSDSLEQIGSVLDKSSNFIGNEESLSIVCRVAKLVATHLGVTLQIIAGKSYDGSDALSELAKDSNIRLRKVALKDNWYKQDNGALFGYYQENQEFELKPVALIPQKTGDYICISPEYDNQENQTLRVDENLSSKIHPFAYMFYRPLQDKPVNFWQLIKFSSHGMLKDAILFVMLGILTSIVGLLIPELTRVFMDTIIPQAAKNMAVQISALVLLCVISAAIFSFVKALAMTRMETRSDASLQSAVMDRLLKLPVGFFKDFTAGELAQKTMAVSSMRSMVFGTVISSGMSLIFALVYLFQLFRYSGYLLAWGLLFCIVPIVLTAAVTFIKYKWNKQLIEISSHISGTLFQFVTGVNKLVMTASEKRAFSVWAKMFARQNESTSCSERVDIVYSTFTSAYSLIVTMAFYGIFMKAISTGKMDALSTGSFMAFMSSYAAFQGSLISTANALTQSIQIVPMYEQAKIILQAEPEIQESKPAVSKLSGAIEISHISFRYSPDTPLILKDVSIKINPGEFIAIVGGSGSGKSTLLRVLLGFEKAEAGSVFFDNQDLSSLDVGSIRRNMGVVLQNSTIMQGSIYSNIIGSSALSIDDAWKAAEMAGLADDIRDMPMGMHTMVSTGGGTLSGGQRQRLIIARAIARRPNILIFDEATSALDNRTQAQVSNSLESLKVTRIVIAHRLSTIINADRIYVLNHGVIEESGNYEELMKKDGFFAELAKRQQV